MAWVEGNVKAQREAAACVVTSYPAEAGDKGKRATPWQIVVSLLLWVELRCAATAAQEPHKERVLTRASDWLNMLFAIHTSTPTAHCRMVVEIQARLVNIAQDAAVSTLQLSSGLNGMVHTLARAQVEGAESGDEGSRVLLFALERCAALLWRRSASSSPGGETALLGSGLALLVRQGSPELCSSALHVLEAALDAACPTSVEHQAGVVRWCETLCTALSDTPWWQSERSPMQERLEATRQPVDAHSALNQEVTHSLLECWARAEALVLRSADRPTELLRSRLSVLRHASGGWNVAFKAQPSEDAALPQHAQLQAMLQRQRRRAVPCTFLASFLRHCAGSPGRSDALVSSLWACYGDDIEKLWFCAMVDPAVEPARQQDLSSQLRVLASSLPDAQAAQSALLPALQVLPMADFTFRDSFTLNRTAVLLRVLRCLATLLPPGGITPRAKLERAEMSLRPIMSLLTRRLEEAAKLDRLRGRSAGAETSESTQLAYRVARELWGLPHVLRSNGGQMVKLLVDGLLLRPAPAGCEAALLELLPVALAGMCEAGSSMQLYMQRKICEVVLHFRGRPGSDAATDNPRLKWWLVRGLVLPRLQLHDSASKRIQDHVWTVLSALHELGLIEAMPNAPPLVGPATVPGVTDHLLAAELVLPYLLRLAVLTGLQTGAECKLSFELQRATLKLLEGSPTGLSLLEQLESRSSDRAELVLDVLSFLGVRACLTALGDHVETVAEFQLLFDGSLQRRLLVRLQESGWITEPHGADVPGAPVVPVPLPKDRVLALELGMRLQLGAVGLYSRVPEKQRTLATNLDNVFRKCIEVLPESGQSQLQTAFLEEVEPGLKGIIASL